MMDHQYILEMIDISKEFPGVKALDKVTLRLKSGSVHALMGENGAGKSTLMKCLFGIYHKDSGEILLEGNNVNFQNSRQALINGVAMVQQELNQATKRSVMDNLWLGRYPQKHFYIDHKKMYADTIEVFKKLDISINPKVVMNNLSVSQRQMVEIAKAVSYNSKVIVFDEPTSSLSDREIEKLFKVINKLKENNVGIIYISHKMEEILKISDEVTILRDGKFVSTTPSKDLTMNNIIKQMVGRELHNRFPVKTNEPKETILKVVNLNKKYPLKIINASFELKKGELLGVYGLVGAGRTELLETLYGTATKESGQVYLKGKLIDNKNSRVAIKNGFALLTEERRLTGIFAVLNIKDNSVIANLKKYLNKGHLVNKKMVDASKKMIGALNIKTPSENTKIQSLSGGNQQKVILGRWLLTTPEILLLDEPTKGIDVGAKYEIYQLMINLACEGKSIMIVSSEMPELLGICDRILVMSNGQVAGIVNTKETNQEELMKLSTKFI